MVKSNAFCQVGVINDGIGSAGCAGDLGGVRNGQSILATVDVGQAAHRVGLGGGDFVTVRLFLTRCTGVTTVGGVTMDPTVGSAAVVWAVTGLGLHGGSGQLRLSGVGRGLDACHSQRVFRWRWNGCGWRKRRSGNHGCGVSGMVSRLAGSRE